MKVFVLEYLGKKCVTANMVEMMSWVEDLIDEGEFDAITIRTKEMTQEELDSLPEFEGY